MKNLFAKVFIKNYQDVKDPKVRNAYGKMCGLVGIVSNLLICAVKIITGILVGSVAILADGINNLADAGSSIITLIGFKLASLPADSDHPYGHQRIEYITGLIVSIVILVIGVLLMKTSIEKIIYGSEAIKQEHLIITIIILVVAILLKLWQSLFYKKNGKAIDSKTLLATSQDSLNDSLSTIAVLISLIISLIWPNVILDGYMGCIVSLFILYSGIKLVKETISPLIGEAPSKEFITMVAEKVLSYDGILGIHDLVIHSYGPSKTFITLHAEVDSKVDVLVSHDIIDNIERDFLNELSLNLVIHLDPIDVSSPEIIELKEKTASILKEIDESLKFHDFRVVNGVTHTNILFDVVVPIKFEMTNEELKELIDKKFKEIDKNYFTVITVDQDLIGRRESDD